jgi:hypothetical protein
VLIVTALFDVNEFVGWVSEDGNGATGILIRIDERRPIDPIAAVPFDGKRGRGFHGLDRFSFAISGEPCGEEIGAVEQPVSVENRTSEPIVMMRPSWLAARCWI